MDLVPGRIQQGYQNYHSLYRRKAGSWTLTNVKLHTDTVAEPGRVQEIRALKVRRSLHHPAFPAFFLELAVIQAPKARARGALAPNVLAALNTLGAELPRLRIVDPANTNDIVSDEMSAAEKKAVAA